MVSEVAFGAGPVSGLMTDTATERQQAVVAHAVGQGINWFDTAAGYGAGQSEANLGAALQALAPSSPVHVATKVRLLLNGETDLRPIVLESFHASLTRLRLPKVTLLQVHNSITRKRNDEPTSITAEDVLGPRGVLEAMNELKAQGLVDHLGLTGIGQPEALREVIRSRQFATIQAPFHLLNPTALMQTTLPSAQPDYGGFLRDAAEIDMGIMAIRVYAAGALVDAPPSPHTHKTPFFPLALYERDRATAQRLLARLGGDAPMTEWALRYALSQPEIATAIVGFATPEQITAAASVSDHGLLSEVEASRLSAALAAIGSAMAP